MLEPLKTYTPKYNSTGRDIARLLMKHVRKCQLKRIGGCKGPLDVAHLDGDENNNERANLKKFCRSHHRLHDLNRIALDSKVMPEFHVRLSGPRKGERRYVETRRRERLNARLRRAGSVNPALFSASQTVQVTA